MFELGSKMLLAYLLGSISGSLVIGRLYGGVDIRQLGSGNAGGTNAFRTQGIGFAVLVIVIDVGKGILAATVIASLPWPPLAPEVARGSLAMVCGGAAVIGHVWPFWHQFRGGKGAGTLIGVYLALAPKLLVIVALVWIISVVATGYVGLSTMLAALGAAVGVPFLYAGGLDLFSFGLAMAALIVFTHRANIARMHAGNENRFAKAMFWRRREP